MSSVHGFLHRFYRLSERSRAPRCVSMELERSGTLEGAMRAAEWRVWSLIVMGRVERDPRWSELHARVLGAYYLHLAIDHVAVIETEVDHVVDEQGLPSTLARPDAEVTLGTLVSWAKVAEIALGKRSTSARREAKRALFEGIEIVRAAMHVDDELQNAS